MKAAELALFDSNEQTRPVATERGREARARTAAVHDQTRRDSR